MEPRGSESGNAQRLSEGVLGFEVELNGPRNLNLSVDAARTRMTDNMTTHQGQLTMEEVRHEIDEQPPDQRAMAAYQCLERTLQ